MDFLTVRIPAQAAPAAEVAADAAAETTITTPAAAGMAAETTITIPAAAVEDTDLILVLRHARRAAVQDLPDLWVQ